MSSSSERIIDVRGSRVRVLEGGEGPAVLYLHGSGDNGAWLRAHELLATHRRVVRPDHPGFNGSETRPDIDSVHELAYFYLDLLDALGLERVSVVGASLGGWIAADLATIDPGRVSELVLVGACGLRVEDAPMPDVFVLSAPQIAELTFADDGVRAGAVEAARAMEASPDALQAYLRNRIATAHLAWNPYFHDPKLVTRLHRIGAPTLVVWGAEDRLVPLPHADAWQAALPDARTEVLAGAGHLPHVEQPEQFVELVRTFLAECAERPVAVGVESET